MDHDLPSLKTGTGDTTAEQPNSVKADGIHFAFILFWSALLWMSQVSGFTSSYPEYMFFYMLLVYGIPFGWCASRSVGRWCALDTGLEFYLMYSCLFVLAYTSLEMAIFGYPAGSLTASITYTIRVLIYGDDEEIDEEI